MPADPMGRGFGKSTVGWDLPGGLQVVAIRFRLGLLSDEGLDTQASSLAGLAVDAGRWPS